MGRMQKNLDGSPWNGLFEDFSKFTQEEFQVSLDPKHQKNVHPIRSHNILKAMEYAYERGQKSGIIIGYEKGLSKALCSWCEEWHDKNKMNIKGLCGRCSTHDI